MNFHQTTEEVIKNATAEQRILWNYIFLTFGEKIGVSQFYYQGVSLASEFTIYSANKLYLALSLKFSYSSSSPAGIVSNAINFYGANNVVNFSAHINCPVWDVTGAVIKYSSIFGSVNNLFFARVNTSYDLLSFCGYRLSI